MAEINLDTGSALDIKVRKDHSFDLEISFFEDDGTTPLFLSGTFKMAIAKDTNGEDIVMTLTAGNGLQITDSKIAISRSIVQNTLADGVYYYDLRNDKPTGKSVSLFFGRLFVNKNITKP